MADSSELTTWLLNHAERINLQATEMSWVRDWGLPGHSDIQVKIDVGGMTYTGRGTAADEDLAFLKAGAEAIERTYCAGHQVHSTGVAVHTNNLAAVANVQNELNERDAFFCHYYTKTPFLPVPDSEHSELINANKGAFDKIQSLGISLRLFRAKSMGAPVFLCIASGLTAMPKFGGVVGLGSRANEWQSIQIAFLECMRNVAAIVTNGVPATITRANFDLILNPKSTDRQRLALNVDYWKEISYLFPDVGNQSDFSPPKATKASPWVIEKLSCPFDELKDAPVVVYRGRLDESKGQTLLNTKDRSPTTMQRLSEFLRRPLTLEQLEFRPHFLG